MKPKSLYDSMTGKFYGAVTDGMGTVYWIGDSKHQEENDAFIEAQAMMHKLRQVKDEN